MPCWYYEKKEIKNSPSYQDGIDSNTECRYRRDGARFIIDAGTKLGLRFDTCATGVVYFHRFYMFHSFKEFPRHVTAACCLFLAGKVEETPKKCRDIIKISQQLLTAKQFSVFGDDPREEVMTLERILLQTVKFDLQMEHPYALLLRFAKGIKGDKEKVQKLVQMAWTFINDSLCTTLCLQWEPEIIAVSLMYLGTRLNKFEIVDWVGRVPGTKQKWWECFVEDLTVDLMEDICHQVLDLYSPGNQPGAEESPPPPPPVLKSPSKAGSQAVEKKRSHPTTPSEAVTPGSQSSKSQRMDRSSQDRSSKTTPVKNDRSKQQITTVTSHSGVKSQPTSAVVTPVTTGTDPYSMQQQSATNTASNPYTVTTSASPYPQSTTADSSYSQFNPYISTNMFSSSFMSQEGSQSIHTMMNNPQATNQYNSYTAPPPGMPPYGMPPGAVPQYQSSYPPSSYPPSVPPPGQPPFPTAPPPQQFQGTGYPAQGQAYQGYAQSYPPALQQQSYPPPGGAYPGATQGHRPPMKQQKPPQPKSSSSLTVVRISGRS